jgi:hypothetical protein
MTRFTGFDIEADAGDLRDDDNGIGGGVIFAKGGDGAGGCSDRLRVRLAAASGDAPGCAYCETGDLGKSSDPFGTILV